jgi:hypothetical protein
VRNVVIFVVFVVALFILNVIGAIGGVFIAVAMIVMTIIMILIYHIDRMFTLNKRANDTSNDTKNNKSSKSQTNNDSDDDSDDDNSDDDNSDDDDSADDDSDDDDSDNGVGSNFNESRGNAYGFNDISNCLEETIDCSPDTWLDIYKTSSDSTTITEAVNVVNTQFCGNPEKAMEDGNPPMPIWENYLYKNGLLYDNSKENQTSAPTDDIQYIQLEYIQPISDLSFSLHSLEIYEPDSNGEPTNIVNNSISIDVSCVPIVESFTSGNDTTYITDSSFNTSYQDINSSGTNNKCTMTITLNGTKVWDDLMCIVFRTHTSLDGVTMSLLDTGNVTLYTKTIVSSSTKYKYIFKFGAYESGKMTEILGTVHSLSFDVPYISNNRQTYAMSHFAQHKNDTVNPPKGWNCSETFVNLLPSNTLNFMKSNHDNAVSLDLLKD